MKAVEGSLGCNEPPKTVMTADAADEYEKKLIEAAKQQSLQEMVKFSSLPVHVYIKQKFFDVQKIFVNLEYRSLKN